MINTILIVAGIVLALIAFFLIMKFGLIYVRALSAGCPVGVFNLVGMWLRRVQPEVIVDGRITAFKAGLEITFDQIETHFLAGGHVMNVVLAMVMASKAKINLSWNEACSIDLAGRDILDAIRTSTNPKVIDVPAQGGGPAFISAIAKDGIQLKVKARVTVRTNLQQLVGGAVEETIIARVGEGIVTTIGSADTHKNVLENPDTISKRVLEKGLDNGTAFEILSIDIADVDVGDNIGAKLKSDQAQADKIIAQAQAEKRRAMAVAMEQENIAKVMDNRAKLVEAESKVPLAVAEALRSGNIGVMDYLQMKNIQADTDMRDTLGGKEHRRPGEPGGEDQND